MDRLRRQEGLCELRKTNMNTMVIVASMLLLRLEVEKTWVLPENLRDFQIPLYVMVFEIHGFEPIKFWFNLGPNPNPFLLTYPNKGFGFGPSNPNPNPRNQTDHKAITIVDAIYCNIKWSNRFVQLKKIVAINFKYLNKIIYVVAIRPQSHYNSWCNILQYKMR